MEIHLCISCCSLALESTFNFSFPFLCCAGQNCLHLASVQGFLSLVERLVDLGADIDAKVTFTSSVWKKSKNSLLIFVSLFVNTNAFASLLFYRSSITVAARSTWLWTSRISSWSNCCWKKERTQTSWALGATAPITSPLVWITGKSTKSCTLWPILTWGSCQTASQTTVTKRSTWTLTMRYVSKSYSRSGTNEVCH